MRQAEDSLPVIPAIVRVSPDLPLEYFLEFLWKIR